MNQKSTYVPKSAPTKWLEQRLPLGAIIHSTAVSFPVPRNLNYLWTFGGILTFALALQIVTGIALSFHYTPTTAQAFSSVESIMRDVNYGWLLRYLHATGASMFFGAIYVHIFRGLYYGSHKSPREVVWILGVFILLVLMATAFTGYVLPWGQMSFWAATVITKLFSAIPFVGQPVVTWLWGGFSVDDPTLHRFYSLHFLLPFVIIGIVALHVWAIHHVGQNNPSGVEVRDVRKETVPFTPYAAVKDGFALAVFLIVLAWLVFYQPNYLLSPDNYVEANPLKTPPHIVPEWYFLPFYAILRAIPSKLGGVIAMFGSIAVLAFVPWLDTSRVRSSKYRPLHRWLFWLFVAACIGLGYVGSRPPEGAAVIFARLLAAYYFIYFLVLLPLVGLIERPGELPHSIASSTPVDYGQSPS